MTELEALQDKRIKELMKERDEARRQLSRERLRAFDLSETLDRIQEAIDDYDGRPAA